MNMFSYQNNELYVEHVPIVNIARQYGTPCYIYSQAEIISQWTQLEQAFGSYPHRICYAVKANSSLAILQLLAKQSAGFDIVSEGELERVLKAGGKAENIVFSGVAKSKQEIKHALEVGIFCFNVESSSELQRLNEIAKELNTVAPIALRINPNIDAQTHPYIATGLHDNKFGIEIQEALMLCQQLSTLSHIKLISVGCHIGSQLTSLTPFEEAIDSLLHVVEKLKSLNLSPEYINVGGGLGVTYQNEIPPSMQDYVSTIVKKIKPHGLKIIIEPGRCIIANAGILVTTVEYIKKTPYKNFAIIDAGMNDLIRPALYEAWQNIIPVKISSASSQKEKYDIVGPVCESADFLGKDRMLSLQENDLLAICSAGAYGFSMTSNYNSRPRPPEILVDGEKIHLIRQRETIQQLFSLEQLI